MVHCDVPLTPESLVHGVAGRRNSGIHLEGIRRGVFSKHLRFTTTKGQVLKDYMVFEWQMCIKDTCNLQHVGVHS